MPTLQHLILNKIIRDTNSFLEGKTIFKVGQIVAVDYQLNLAQVRLDPVYGGTNLVTCLLSEYRWGYSHATRGVFSPELPVINLDGEIETDILGNPKINYVETPGEYILMACVGGINGLNVYVTSLCLGDINYIEDELASLDERLNSSLLTSPIFTHVMKDLPVVEQSLNPQSSRLVSTVSDKVFSGLLSVVKKFSSFTTWRQKTDYHYAGVINQTNTVESSREINKHNNQTTQYGGFVELPIVYLSNSRIEYKKRDADSGYKNREVISIVDNDGLTIEIPLNNNYKANLVKNLELEDTDGNNIINRDTNQQSLIGISEDEDGNPVIFDPYIFTYAVERGTLSIIKVELFDNLDDRIVEFVTVDEDDSVIGDSFRQGSIIEEDGKKKSLFRYRGGDFILIRVNSVESVYYKVRCY